MTINSAAICPKPGALSRGHSQSLSPWKGFQIQAQTGGVVACRTVSIREKLFTLLLGPKQKVMVVVPGNTVESIAITEVPMGGGTHEYAKPDSTELIRPSTAACSSAPSAMMRMVVPPTIPRDRTPSRLFAFTRRSSFSTQMEDLNSFAFWIKKVAGRACRPT